jgi:hypothetical protein
MSTVRHVKPRSKRALVSHLTTTRHGSALCVTPPPMLMAWTMAELEAEHRRLCSYGDCEDA